MKQCRPGPRWGSLYSLSLLALTSLLFSCKGGTSSPDTPPGAPSRSDEANPVQAGQQGENIESSNQLATKFIRVEEGERGTLYVPYIITGEMNTPRYQHQAIRLKDGLIFISGGTDERGFSTVDTCEIFDELGVRKGERRSPTGSGVFIDTDFEGNPIVMQFRRLWHTMNLLPDNRVIFFGGSADWIRSRPSEDVEVFAPDTRTFETLEDVKLIAPRTRHTSVLLPDGNIALLGGQVHELFRDIQTVTNPAGGVMQQTVFFDIFPSTNVVEVFSFRDLELTRLTRTDSGRPSTLSSSRGRTGHVTISFAGFDNQLKTGDDPLLMVGGFQTPSFGPLVQGVLVPRFGVNVNMKGLEVYDPTERAFNQIATTQLESDRVNDPQATNLGVHNEVTPDGVPGLGNVILIAHGDNNAPCFMSPFRDELFTATFSGLGFAQGIELLKIQYTDIATDGHIHDIEAETAGPCPGGEVFCGTPAAHRPGRTMTNFVTLPRFVNTPDGQLTTGTWVFTGGGAHVFCTPPGPVPYYEGTIASGAIFDPLYRLLPATAFTADPPANARDLLPSRNQVNPTGVMGTWLALDGRFPSTDRVGFGDVPFGTWPHIESNRIWPRLLAVAGQDGIIDTPDDRILFTGGGTDAIDLGGETAQPSSEMCLTNRAQQQAR